MKRQPPSERTRDSILDVLANEGPQAVGTPEPLDPVALSTSPPLRYYGTKFGEKNWV